MRALSGLRDPEHSMMMNERLTWPSWWDGIRFASFVKYWRCTLLMCSSMVIAVKSANLILNPHSSPADRADTDIRFPRVRHLVKLLLGRHD